MWLRAAVLGADDALVSTASLMIGVAASAASKDAILVDGVAGLVAGSMSMAVGEYVSVRSPRDSEKADIERETRELESQPRAELNELATLYTASRSRTKSMKPRSTSARMSFTRTRSPTSRSSNPCTTFPSTGGLKIRTHVPLSDAPVTMASKRSPIRDAKSSAAADFRDALFVGSTYGPQGITVAVRIGFDDNRAMGERETGGRAALPIFREIMLRVYQDKLLGPVPHFPREIEEGINAYLATQVVVETSTSQ